MVCRLIPMYVSEHNMVGSGLMTQPCRVQYEVGSTVAVMTALSSERSFPIRAEKRTGAFDGARYS